MRRKRAYHYRCYPTAAQATMLASTFGCARYVYNWGLRLRIGAWDDRQKRLGYTALSAALTYLKQQPLNMSTPPRISPPWDTRW